MDIALLPTGVQTCHNGLGVGLGIARWQDKTFKQCHPLLKCSWERSIALGTVATHTQTHRQTDTQKSLGEIKIVQFHLGLRSIIFGYDIYSSQCFDMQLIMSMEKNTQLGRKPPYLATLALNPMQHFLIWPSSEVRSLWLRHYQEVIAKALNILSPIYIYICT